MALPATVKNKKQGDIIRSEDWNIVTNEVDRLDVDKANLKGGAGFTGPLSVQLAVGQPQLRLSGGNIDVGGQGGDISIGGSFGQLRIGVGVTQQFGDARIRSMASSPGPVQPASRLLLGAGNTDLCILNSDGRMEIQGNLFFGTRTTQHINLFGTGYGIGVQDNTAYFRSDREFSWFQGGAHSNTQGDPGAGGIRLMTLRQGGLIIGPQDAKSEGGELQLAGSGSNPTWHLDAHGDRFRIHSNGEKMTVLQNGNVGLGTTSPSDGLEVAAFVRARGYRCRTGVNGVYDGHVFNFTWVNDKELVAYVDGTRVGRVMIMGGG